MPEGRPYDLKVTKMMSHISSSSLARAQTFLRTPFGLPFRKAYLRSTADWVGYEVLVASIQEEIQSLDSDLIEIGSFVGGGTVKLARLAGRYNKKVFAVDLFRPEADQTRNLRGTRMCDMYLQYLEVIGMSQRKAFNWVTRHSDNVVVFKCDSTEIIFPPQQRLCFGFIDGNHDPKYVRNDFELIWNHLVPRGIVGFHDYGGDLPQVTATINTIIRENRDNIFSVRIIPDRFSILITKGRSAMAARP